MLWRAFVPDEGGYHWGHYGGPAVLLNPHGSGTIIRCADETQEASVPIEVVRGELELMLNHQYGTQRRSAAGPVPPYVSFVARLHLIPV